MKSSGSCPISQFLQIIYMGVAGLEMATTEIESNRVLYEKAMNAVVYRRPLNMPLKL